MLVCLKVPFTWRRSQVPFPSLVSEHPQTPLTCLEGDGISYLWLISKLNFIHWAGQTSLPRHRHRPTTPGSPRVEDTISEDLSCLSSDITPRFMNVITGLILLVQQQGMQDNKWPASEDHERNEWDRADHKTKDSFVSVIIWNLVWHHLQ